MSVDVIIPVYNQENMVVRAINSVPYHWNIILVFDGCTDNSEENALLFIKNNNLNNDRRQILIIHQEENKGVANSVNLGLNESKSDYVVLLGSDDYFTPDILSVETYLNGPDLVYFNLRINTYGIIDITPDNTDEFCGSVKFMRREFIGDLRNDTNLEYAEDKDFFEKIKIKKPTEFFTHIVGKHYNFPREGSLNWKAIQELEQN